MNNVKTWKSLESLEQLESAIKDSQQRPVAILKHSTRCSISAMALNRLQRDWSDEEMKNIDFYFLDLISYREISNKIAQKLDVAHQSPQIILIKDGKAIYDNSHMGISYRELQDALSQ